MTIATEHRRALPIAPLARPARRRLPLLEARDVDRAHRPIYAVWEITLRCDLACRHCGSRAGRARPDELSTAEALDVVRQLAQLGVKEVTLIGGEAYLRDDWADIARAVRDSGMLCSMTTGGRAFTAERAKMARDAGVRAVSVSIDGMREAHDAVRALAGSFDAALASIANLRDAGLTVFANTQINRINFEDLESVFALLVEERVQAWLLQITTAMGRAGDTPDLLLEPYRVLELMPRLARLKERAAAAKMRLWPGNNIGYFGPYEARLQCNKPDKHGGACGAGRVTIGLEANGDVKGCPSLPTHPYAGGNVRDASLADIWEGAAPLRFMRDRTVDDLWGYCRTCYYAEACLGGCNWTTHVLFGKTGNNPYCHHRALELKNAGKRERLARVEAADGQPFDYGRFEIVLEDWTGGEP